MLFRPNGSKQLKAKQSLGMRLPMIYLIMIIGLYFLYNKCIWACNAVPILSIIIFAQKVKTSYSWMFDGYALISGIRKQSKNKLPTKKRDEKKTQNLSTIRSIKFNNAMLKWISSKWMSEINRDREIERGSEKQRARERERERKRERERERENERCRDGESCR